MTRCLDLGIALILVMIPLASGTYSTNKKPTIFATVGQEKNCVLLPLHGNRSLQTHRHGHTRGVHGSWDGMSARFIEPMVSDDRGTANFVLFTKRLFYQNCRGKKAL